MNTPIEIDAETLELFLGEAKDTLASWEQACLALDRDHADRASIDELFRVAHSLKGTARAVGLMAFGDFIHHVEDVITKLKKAEIVVDSDVVGFLFAAESVLKDWISGLGSDPGYKPPTQDVEDQIRTILSGEKRSDPSALAGAATPIPPAADGPGLGKGETRTEAKTSSDESIRLPIKKLDQLIQLVGELSIQQAIVMHQLQQGKMDADETRRAVNLGSKIVKDLQHQALSLRMQSLKPLFQRLERTARDIARTQGKQIDVVCRGDEVELDKNVIERVVDPLIHIVRNAVDHGIETEPERKSTTKPEMAQVRLEAFQEADSVVLEIADDGRGLNRDKILRKAVEKGLADGKKDLSDDELFQMILLPGFSTAETVTDLSGRGVGMDVVRKAVEDIGGRIEIRSEFGNGSCFRIGLPTSVSILDALITTVNQQKYVVPIKALEEVVDSQRCKVHTSGGKGKMIEIRGEYIPLFDLPQMLKFMGKVDENCTAALIVKSGSKRVALLTNEVITQHQVVVRPLPEKYKSITVFNGSTILSNGEPSFILDVAHISRNLIEQNQRKEVAA